MADPGFALKILNPKRALALESLADILLPRGGRFNPGAADLNLTAQFEHLMRTMPSRARGRVLLLLRIFDASPITDGRFRRPFHALPRNRQVEWIEKVEISGSLPKRAPYLYLRQILMILFASTPEFEESIGFDYTCRRDGEVHGR